MREIAIPFTEHLKKTQQYSDESQGFLIEYLRDQLREDPLNELFWQGEIAFHSKDYKNALKHYLQAKDLPDYKFYCYRASAFLSHEIGQNTKALIFANKALKIHPEDHLTLKILDSLYAEYDEWEKRDMIRAYAQELQESRSESETFEILSGIKSLVNQNLKDLHENPEDDEMNWDSTEALVAGEILKEFIDEAPCHFKETEECFTSFATKVPEQTNMVDKLEEYSRRHQKHLEDYLQKVLSRPAPQENCMLLMNTWSKDSQGLSLPTEHPSMNEQNDGLFIRFAGKGIAVNPGPRFLEALYKKNFSLLDIDYVIVTHSRREAFQDISGIFELASEINRLLGKPHVIHYYFNRIAYQEMIQILKPRYRQEKSALHCLEIYLDTPDVEKIELQKGITLGYFLTSKSFNPLNPSGSLNLGIKLDLQEGTKKRSIAYVSSSQWTPLLGAHVGDADILIAGFGYTQKSDLEGERYLDDCLGYFGTATLIQESPPALAIITEFDKRVAGARLEIIKKIRENVELPETTVIPGDPDLFVDLSDIKIRCSITGSLVAPDLAKVVQGSDPVSGLQFLSPASYI